MKNEKNAKEQIPFHLGKPELKDKKERALSEQQNRQKNNEKDARQVEKKDNAKKTIVAESERGKKEGKGKN